MMKLSFISLLVLAVVNSCLATGTISFNTTLVEVEETDFKPVVLTIERSGTTNGAISFSCTILNSTQDFHADSVDTASFSAGQTSSQCTFYVKDDSEPEGDEIYAVRLGLISGNNVNIGQNLVYIKILANDDGRGVLGFDVVGDVIVEEPRTAGGVVEQLSIRRSIAAFGSIAVHWRVTSAVANNDTTPTSGVVEFKHGQSVNTLNFSVRSDLLIEQDEEFEFELTSVSGGARLNATLSEVLVRVLANDIPVRFALSHVVVLENQTNVDVWIYRGLDASGTNPVATVDRTSTVAWYLSSDGATRNQDFHQASGTVVFNNGETRKMINVAIIDDVLPEKSENFTVHLTNLSADVSLVSPSQCTIQILHNDDHVGVFELSGDGNVTIDEDGDSNVVQITINRTAGAFGMVNVTWMVTSPQSGNLSKQISPMHGAVIFGDGERQNMVNLTVTDDMVPEEAFWFVVELISTSGGRITNNPSGRSKKVIVRDSDDVYGIFGFSNDTYQTLSLTSQPRMVNFAVSRNGGILGTVAVGYVVSYHSVDGANHTTSIGIKTSGTVSFSPGGRSVAVSLNISKEGFIRANSVFRIRLTSLKLERPANTLVSPRTPRFGARTAANLTVHAQYADGEIGFQETRVTVTEPENGRPKQINLVVFRDGTLFRASLLWSIVGVKSSADLNPTNGNLVFEKGQNSVNITIEILLDTTPELDESFTIQLHNVSESNQKLQSGSSELILTIARNDNAGGVFQFVDIDKSILSESVNNQLTVTVERVGGDLDERWVQVKTINGKDDFISGEHVMRFPKGVRRSSDEFYVKNDDIPETNETLIFRLFPFGPSDKQGTLGNPTEFNVTILANDDANGRIVFSNTSLFITESKDSRTSARFVVERQRGLFGVVSVSWNVTSGAAEDISPTSGKVEFKEGEKFKILEIFSVEDEIPELDENFTLTLTRVEGGAKLGDPRQALLTILRNDDAVEFAAPTHVRVDEGERAAFTILRHGRTDEAIYVNYTTKDGSARSADRDYTPITQQVLFDAGETRKSFSVSIREDDKPETDENFTIVLTSSTGDTSIYGNKVVVVTIAASDDPNGIFHFNGNSQMNKTANENSIVSFNVTRDRGIFGRVSVLWQIYQVFSNGSRHALESGDFDETSGALVFEDLEPSKNLVLNVMSDDLAEYGEHFEVVLENVTGGSPGPGGELSPNLTVAYIYIPTNDNPYGLFAFARNSLDVSVAEDTEPGFEYKATANLTVLRKRGKDRDVGVSWCIYPSGVAASLKVWDLVFLSKTMAAKIVNDPKEKRANTGSHALEFTNSSYAVVESQSALLDRTGFTISVWLRPKAGHSGTILAKVLNTKDVPYRLMIDTNGNVTLRIELLVTGDHTLTAWKEVGRRLLDGKWHNIMVVVDSESGVLFYYDSDHIGTNSSMKFVEIRDGKGDLYLGVSRPNIDQFEGLLQDVKIFTETLKKSDVSAIAKPVTEITPINGYLDYPESLASRVVALTTTDNDLPEDEEKYSVILVSSRGGADIDSSSNSIAKLTVLKSDNVNGLFAFAFGQSLSRAVSESAGNISFEIQRTLGFRGEVVVNWAIFRESGSRASGDFVQPTGSLLFAKEERKKSLTVSVLNDNRPELQERFEVRLVSAQSNDGKDESTATSGASVNPLFSIANVTIEENDSPYGLLQFASEVPRNASISPLTHAFKMDVRESAGTFKLYIERAQGIVGDIECSWKIEAMTATAGVDYVDDAGFVSLAAGQQHTSIDITLRDNDQPELNKTFRVELYDPKNGAEVGAGGVAIIVIEPSDDAFGVINFTSSSLAKSVMEGQTLVLEVQRSRGTLGDIVIGWEIVNARGDLTPSSGEVFMKLGERRATFSVIAHNDLSPELTESYLVRLVNVTSGRLSSRGIVSNVTILANDDPYGVFEFEPTFLAVDEGNRNVTVRVVRRQGSVGETRVYYTSVAHNVTVHDVTYNRAEENRDFHPVSGFVDFQPNQTSGSFVLAIMDDDLPEDNETIVVNLTRATLSGSEGSALSFPRIGSERLVQVVILRNDNASGIVYLSSSAVAVREDTRGAFLNIVRSHGAFGQITVDIEVTSKETDSRKDYRISTSKVTLSDGQRTAPVPISIVNDHDPELNETFTVRLFSNDGSVVIGLPSQCEVTIQENDYPYGLIGFSPSSLNKFVNEPSSGNQVVDLDVIREHGYGTLGVVKFAWEVTLSGRLATKDVRHTQGSGLIPPGKNKTSIEIVILADNVPEVNEVLRVTLSVTEGKDELDPVRRHANVTIILNDEAHGVIEFSQDSYTAHENDHNTTVHIPIVRKRGTHGDVRVYYSTIQDPSSSSAIPNQDYISVVNASVDMADGSNTSSVDVVILGDVIPELRKYFTVVLEYAELVQTGVSSRPRLGSQSSVNVTIEDDDHVYGLFKVFGERNQTLIVVNETENLPVSFEVRRLGGATGDVSVKVIISPTSTARKGEDFKGSDFTLDFKPGERTKSFSLTVDNDDIPELDETIIVKLVNPTAGASVAQGIGNNVSVIIQANDVVAGYVGFSLMSRALVVEEGEMVYLKVVRTSPAAGMVTVDWLIQGRNVTKDFNGTSGTVLFKEGENATYIRTRVIADNTSEIDEPFQVILGNPVTSGISQTGAAEINADMATATVTIAASDEPHGVFEFQQSSRRFTAQESANIVELPVARLFGKIGTVRVNFTIMNGSLHSLSSDERLAAVGTDVIPTSFSILVNDGVSVGAIPLTIFNDSLAELDEYFVVNITNVELVNKSLINSYTFTPPRLGRYSTSEVKIEKNDGPYGILVFSPARVNVPENVTSFNLTVQRTQGTFGEIEVRYSITLVSIDESDFSVYGNLQIGGEGSLKFDVGEREENITVFINDDVIPEDNELFEVHLKSPSGGALLGLDSIAYVTVLMNDAANGIFRFSEGSLGITVDEPGSRHVGKTRANFTVVRDNGTIGEVVVGWRIANLTASVDFKHSNGTVLFKHGERMKTFAVETIVDTVPEKEERFLVALSVVGGGGELTTPNQAWLTVSENDEPYGELEFAVAPRTLNIEETIGRTEIKVLRRKGTYGSVTVHYQTISQTADSSEGPIMRFGVFQTFKTQNARKWFSFPAYDKQYLLLAAGNGSGGSHSNDDVYSTSALFYWQGEYTHITNINSNNAVQFESFQVNNRYYIAVANRGSMDDYEVNSSVYQMFEDGSVSHYQHISTKSASDVKFFRPRGSGDSYLIFANMKDNTGNTAVPSKVYKWSDGNFVQHGRDLNCRGASGLVLFTINNREFLAISSFYDSVNRNFQSKSVIFEWKTNQFQPQQEITTNGATGVEYLMADGDHLLLFVNSRSSPALYKWNAATFVLHQELHITDAKSVKKFSINEEIFLVSTTSEGASQVWKWDSRRSNFLFYTNVTEHGAEDIQPITIQDSVNRSLTLLAVAMETTSQSQLLYPALLSAQADFIPRKGELIFDNGDTELSFYVTIFNDSISEPDETFMVALSNATGGSVIGPNGNLRVNILSNGNPYGRIQFAKASGHVVVEERSRDWMLYLDVLREQGNYGEVVVTWNSTGNVSARHGDNDVYPASGEVVFMPGETRKTINLTIVADDIPEVNEVFQVSLTSLVKNGSNVPNQGATINPALSTSTVVIRANDEPHGIVGWQRTIVLAQESEATNSTAQLVIERLRGEIGDIKVSYSTLMAKINSSANERPAVPNLDFIPVTGEIVMADGDNVTNISIHVIHDDNAEINEVFYVNITAVQLLNPYSIPPENSPRINPSSQTAKVVISENDNRRGELNFNINHLVNPRTGIIRVNEDVGVLRVPVVRTGGAYGVVGFEYRLVPYTVNDNDFSPTKGEIIFLANETSRVFAINITDDDTAEVDERFRLEMTQPIGGAKLGAKREVTVEIRASDQPYGVFEFASVVTVLVEEGREISLTVKRSQGNFREIHVSWNVSADAFPDISPANGTLTFHDNVTTQVIRIRARNDDIPEGDKVYECYLVSADNGAVIGSDRKVTIRIDANDDGYGVLAVDSTTSLVYVGEPDSLDYDGQVVVSIIRKAGAYEEVPVDWELTSDGAVSGQVAETFNVTRGTIVFPDGVRMRNITLQVKQDPYPEESANYTLRLVGTRDARIDQSASQASVVVVSSDHPYGIIDFVGPTSYNVSEDVGHVTLRVIRNKGHTGRLLVTINVASSGATEGKDFEISPKVLIIEDKKDYGSINVSILAEAVPELPESFTVSLGDIQLVTSRYINYGYMNGLQVDMPPETGSKNKVEFSILKNDDAHGVVEFRQSRLVVHEHDGRVVVSVLRTGGLFGVIQVQYSVTNITAEYGQDYIFSDGQITFNNGQQISNLTIPLLDDAIPEDRESFRLDLTSVSGGARVGARRSLEIVLETSDNPHGLFGFVNQTRLVFPNSNKTRSLKLGVARIGGARSFVRVIIRVLMIFPSSGATANDINPDRIELSFQANEFGPKICEFSIWPFVAAREEEEHFHVSITEVSGSASIDSLTQNVTVVILKHGMPNGLFAFSSDSIKKTVSEDSSGPVLLTVDRKEGRKGTVEVKWAVSQSGGSDFVNSEGSLIFLPNEQSKQIRLNVRNDNDPELNEEFTVSLLTASGGGDIDPRLGNATVTIRASDNPHGSFRIASNTQRITVENDLSRVLRFAIQRVAGTFGDVRVNYQLLYSRNYPSSLSGFVVMKNGESDKTQSIVLDENTFLSSSSHFTLTLANVVYQGEGETEIPPSLISSASTVNIPVPDFAANSMVKFKDGYTALTVNQDNLVSRVIVTRDGLYGNVTVSISSGSPVNEYTGFAKGKVEPSVSSLTFHGNVRDLEFSIQVTPVLVPKQKMVYATYVSGVTTPRNVRGGARIEESAQTSIIEPGGVFVVAMETQNIIVRENNTALVTVYRVFSTLGTVQVAYTTRRTSTAVPNQDYVDTSSTLTMVDGEYRKEIQISIINDNLPELDETFSVQLTGVTGANARLGANRTSSITIEDDDSPYGVLSFAANSLTVRENVSVVDVIVSRTGGTYGDVSVLVRTIGGGESWTSGAREGLNDVLRKREKSSIAVIGDDYHSLNKRLTFNSEVPTPSNGQNQTVQLRIINDDIPEVEEEIFMYLSDLTGGGVLASPSSGGQSWTVVKIAGNDLLNGRIYFETNTFTLDEDKKPTGEIRVSRSNNLGTAKIHWEVFNSMENLEETSGTLTLPPGETTTTLRLEMKQDNEPELPSNFTVKLVSLVDTSEAVIDPAANMVTVTVLASDDPAGLIGFNTDSRNMAVDASSTSVALSITRTQGTHGRVTVSYITSMLPEKYTDNDLVIDRAIENKDYRTTQGVLVFDTGKRSPDKEIVIQLTPNSASDTAYPKAFNVTLFNITAGARLSEEYSTTMLIISNDARTTQFLNLRSDSLNTPLSNEDMIRILNSLSTKLSQDTLTATHVSITADILSTILDDLGRRTNENDRVMTSELSDVFMNVFDALLDPEREDFKGKSQLTQPFVKYAFALLHGEACPGTTVVKKTGKYATVEGRRRHEKDINNLIIKSSSSKNFFTYPSNIYRTTNSVGESEKCSDVHFIEYHTSHWFNKDSKEDLLNDRVLSTSVKNSSDTNPGQGSSYYRIYTGERRVTPKGAECLKWHKETWDNTICSVKEEADDYVECECKHFSNFAVRAQSDDRVGYEFYFYIAAFICMISFFLVMVSYFTCSLANTFSAKLLMHMFFAGFALHLLVIVAAYISPDLTDKPDQCTALGILIHYFLLAHFCWIFVQCCNLWRILVLNDEHTERKFILYFMLGWGIPVLCIALYVIITHAIYDWDITETYADVHNNGDMCFIPNAYGVLASVLAPVLLFLLAVGVVIAQAYQVTLQWKLYDDIFRGHHNIKEVMHLWIVFFAITMTWLFGGLHLAFGKLWLAIFFAIFDVFTGLYVFMVYFVLRNQCRKKYRDETYLLHASSPSLYNPSPTDYYAERPVMYDAQSVHSQPKSELRLSPPEGNEWEEFEYDGATPKGSRRGFNDAPLAQLNPLYDLYHGKKPGDEINDDVIEMEEEELSVDLNELVRALKTGETLPGEHDGKDEIVELKQDAVRTDKLELRRVSIADTHV